MLPSKLAVATAEIRIHIAGTSVEMAAGWGVDRDSLNHLDRF
jgi:hypothetical protein